MSKKQTLSTWLRSREVYQDVADQDEQKAKASLWRDVVLAEIESSATIVEQKSVSREAANTPLEVHHLLMLMPVGLVLFGMGWLFGSQAISMEQISRISPWVWVGCSLMVSAGSLFWYKHNMGWRR